MCCVGRFGSGLGRLGGRTRAALALLIVVGLHLSLGIQVAQAYDWDTHYAFTYYLARKIGYSPEEARRIASADVSIDARNNTSTEPIQGYSLSRDAQEPRIKYHAFAVNGETDPDVIKQQIKQRQDDLWREAMATGNPGPFIHFIQDKYSHDGLESKYGQAQPGVGHRPDFVGADGNHDEKMARETVEFLQKFMRDYFPGRTPRDVDPKETAAVMDGLAKANPAPGKWSPNNYNPWREVDEKKALDVIRKALGESVPQPIGYRFDKDGKPVQSIFGLPPKEAGSYGGMKPGGVNPLDKPKNTDPPADVSYKVRFVQRGVKDAMPWGVYSSEKMAVKAVMALKKMAENEPDLQISRIEVEYNTPTGPKKLSWDLQVKDRKEDPATFEDVKRLFYDDSAPKTKILGSNGQPTDPPPPTPANPPVVQAPPPPSDFGDGPEPASGPSGSNGRRRSSGGNRSSAPPPSSSGNPTPDEGRQRFGIYQPYPGGVNSQRDYNFDGSARTESNPRPEAPKAGTPFFNTPANPGKPKDTGGRYGWQEYDPNDPKDKNLKPDYIASIKAKAQADPQHYEITPDGKIVYWPGGVPGGANSSSGGNNSASSGTSNPNIVNGSTPNNKNRINPADPNNSPQSPTPADGGSAQPPASGGGGFARPPASGGAGGPRIPPKPFSGNTSPPSLPVGHPRPPAPRPNVPSAVANGPGHSTPYPAAAPNHQDQPNAIPGPAHPGSGLPSAGQGRASPRTEPTSPGGPRPYQANASPSAGPRPSGPKPSAAAGPRPAPANSGRSQPSAGSGPKPSAGPKPAPARTSPKAGSPAPAGPRPPQAKASPPSSAGPRSPSQTGPRPPQRSQASGGSQKKKYCGHCGNQVPSSSHPGQNCPHCGIHWDYEK
jgi:hypothetical protein